MDYGHGVGLEIMSPDHVKAYKRHKQPRKGGQRLPSNPASICRGGSEYGYIDAVCGVSRANQILTSLSKELQTVDSDRKGAFDSEVVDAYADDQRAEDVDR